MPRELAEAAAPILSDARAAGIVDVEIVVDLGDTDRFAPPWVTDAPADTIRGWVRRTGGESASGISIWLHDPPGLRAWQVAEIVQEHIIESGDNVFPACPDDGRHPLWLSRPGSPDDWPRWQCRSGHEVDCDLGALGSRRTRSEVSPCRRRNR